ncbi:MAG: sigma-70 family RNA polymerase sigma factor [Rhizobiaceae bacterium]|nr:sigma-70 family RNA polymerase sigma factor [Rhizobiaceae bacterium]
MSSSYRGLPLDLTSLMADIAAPPQAMDTRVKAAARSGDAMQQFQRTIVPHMDAAYNFARFLSRDADAAQDIVQDAFLRAYRSFDGFRGGDARAWLFTIVRNCYFAWIQDIKRKARFETPIIDGMETNAEANEPSAHGIAAEEDSPEMALIHKTESERVRAVINTLPDPMREVLVLRELENLSYREIADIIEVPIGTVMSRLARARSDFGDAWQRLEQTGATP